MSSRKKKVYNYSNLEEVESEEEEMYVAEDDEE
jgi:hypothetical protein